MLHTHGKQLQIFVSPLQQIVQSQLGTSKHVKVKVTPHHGGEAAVISTNSRGYTAASKAFEEAWGKTPIPSRDGGSIPIVALFQKVLGLESVLLGFGLDEDALHSPNESYGVFNFYKGIETITWFHKFFAESQK